MVEKNYKTSIGLYCYPCSNDIFCVFRVGCTPSSLPMTIHELGLKRTNTVLTIHENEFTDLHIGNKLHFLHCVTEEPMCEISRILHT